jgi:hypothetical protein
VTNAARSAKTTPFFADRPGTLRLRKI